MGEPTNSNSFAPLDDGNDVSDETPDNQDGNVKVASHSAGSAFTHGMLLSSGIENGREDLGNNENRDEVAPLKVTDEGYLVNENGNKVFTTNEEAIKDGSMVLDAKGRMPGIYLDDLEELQRRQYGDAVEAAHAAAVAGKNSKVERQVNVANSGIPPVTVTSKQEHPETGEAQDDGAEVPVLENNPLPAE